MKHESKRRRAPVNCDTRNQRVHEAKGNRIGYKEKCKSGIQRVLKLQSFRLDGHLYFDGWKK